MGLTCSRYANGELKFRRLTAQRLSKVFRVSLLGTGLGQVQSREARYVFYGGQCARVTGYDDM